jgi:hypothetical protein
MPAICARREPLWNGYSGHWSRLGTPLRPDSDVCTAVHSLLSSHRTRVLLLGVTPEYCSAGDLTVAVDRSRASLIEMWPGDTLARRGMRADWCRLPIASGTFTAAVGDGSFSCLTYPAGYESVLDELTRVVRPGGRAVVRLYAAPERPESVGQIRHEAMTGAIGSVHVLKWRLAHVACAERGTPNLPVPLMTDLFNRTFPDRRALARSTGWSAGDIGMIDVYEGRPDVYSFPTVEQVLAVLPPRVQKVRVVEAGTYELADRCPLLVLDMA